MAKPMLVTLPLVLLLLDFWPLGRSQRMGWGRLVLEKLPPLALSAASGVLTLIAQQAGGAVATLECVPFALRLQNALISILAYIGKMFWPTDLAFFYPFRHEIPLWQPVAAGAAVALLTAFALSQARRRPYLAVGWFWYVITLMPVIGIVQVGGQALADRFTYVPLIGIFMAVAWAAAEWVGTSRARGVGTAAAAALVIVGCLVTTAAQVRTWADSRTLFMHAIAVTSNNYVAHSGLGNLLLAEGEPDEAGYHLAQAARLYPIDPVLHNNLGAALAQCGYIAPAEAAFREALSLKPDYADAHENLGWLMAQEGRLDEAATHLREALRLAPDNRQACEYLVDVLTRQGKLEEAATVAREHGYVAGHGGRPQSQRQRPAVVGRPGGGLVGAALPATAGLRCGCPAATERAAHTGPSAAQGVFLPRGPFHGVVTERRGCYD
jgi:tetratricopeptide (TPR) repeat protein